jgi:hypothetical protein
MNFSDETLIYLSIALAVPMAVLALLNLVFRKRGGITRGWAGAVLIGICWIAVLVVIFKKIS